MLSMAGTLMLIPISSLTDGWLLRLLQGPPLRWCDFCLRWWRCLWLDTNKVVMVTGSQTKENQQNPDGAHDLDYCRVGHVYPFYYEYAL